MLRQLPPNFLLETVRISSYGAGRETSGKVQWRSPAPYCEGQRGLVLDDVLVRFDDVRMRKAVAILRELARNRQVILFTCQGRENDA